MFTVLNLLVLQSRFGDKAPGIRPVCPQIGTAVLMGLSLACFASRCNCFSRSRPPSRLGADITSTPAAAAAVAAAAVAGLDSTKGSPPGAPSGSTQPKPSEWLRRLRPSRSRCSSLSPSLPSLAVLRALSALYVVHCGGFPLFDEALL